MVPAIELHAVVGAWPIGTAGLLLLFEDGPRVADLSTLAEKGGLFAALRDPAFFRQVRVDPEAGTVVWPNGLDLAPEVLHEQSEPVPEDMFEPLLARARRRTVS